MLDGRASSIYRNRPRYCIFGVGDYSFSSWQVAISGFYKSLRFVSVGPIDDRPVVFDDTVYFLPCSSREEAHLVADCLNSKPVQEYLSSMVFWSDKRPITIDLLERVALQRVFDELGKAEVLQGLAGQGTNPSQERLL